MNNYTINEDGSVECLECGCTSTKEQYDNGDCQHWNDCSKLSSDEDMTGPNSDDHDR